MFKKVLNLFTLASFALILVFSSSMSAQSAHKKMQSDSTKAKAHKMRAIDESAKMEKKSCSDCATGCEDNSGHESGDMKGCKTDAKASEAKIWNKVCPVQGDEVDPDAPKVEYKGKTIGFCCAGCDEKFQKDPEKYMKNLSKDGTKFIGKK